MSNIRIPNNLLGMSDKEIEEMGYRFAPKDDPEDPAFPNHTDTDIFVAGFKEGFLKFKGFSKLWSSTQ